MWEKGGIIYALHRSMQGTHHVYVQRDTQLAEKDRAGQQNPHLHKDHFRQPQSRKSRKGFLFFYTRFCQMLLRKHEKIFRGTLPNFPSSA